MESKPRHLRLVSREAQVIEFRPKYSPEVVYLQTLLKCNTIELAEHRRKVRDMEKELRRLKRNSLRVMKNEVNGDLTSQKD